MSNSIQSNLIGTRVLCADGTEAEIRALHVSDRHIQSPELPQNGAVVPCLIATVMLLTTGELVSIWVANLKVPGWSIGTNETKEGE
jgi:hypothetical protein